LFFHFFVSVRQILAVAFCLIIAFFAPFVNRFAPDARLLPSSAAFSPLVFSLKKISPSSCVSAGKGGTEPESGKYGFFIQRGAAFFSP